MFKTFLTSQTLNQVLTSSNAYIARRDEYIEKENLFMLNAIAKNKEYIAEENEIIAKLDELRNKKAAKPKKDYEALKQLDQMMENYGWSKDIDSNYYPSPSKLEAIVGRVSRAKLNEYKNLRIKALGLQAVYDANKNNDAAIEYYEKKLNEVRLFIKEIPNNWKEGIIKRADMQDYTKFSDVSEDVALTLIDSGYEPLIRIKRYENDEYSGTLSRSLVWYDDNLIELFSYYLGSQNYDNTPDLEYVKINMTCSELERMINDDYDNDTEEVDEMLEGIGIDLDVDNEKYTEELGLGQYKQKIPLITSDDKKIKLVREGNVNDYYCDCWEIIE